MHGILQTRVSLLPRESKGIACDDQDLQILHLNGILHVILVTHNVVAKVKFLEQDEVLTAVEQIVVETLEFVPTQIESLQSRNLTKNLHQYRWVD